MAHMGRNDLEGRGQNAMTWTTDFPTEAGWYWVKSDDLLFVCHIHHRFDDKVLMIANFDYDEVPLSSLSFGVQFQPVRPPDGR